MRFQDAVRVCFAKYADFEGEASRSEYWWFFLFIAGASLAVSFAGDVPSILFSLAILLPTLAAATRRLHDTNRSGWWQLACLVPVIGWIVLLVFLVQEGDSETAESEVGETP
jgi:uncharacterized membrane protein YhaH (DUF805 family)